MILRDTLAAVLKDQKPLPPLEPEVERELLAAIPGRSFRALVLTGVRRGGKSTLQTQLMARRKRAFYCNFEDTRLFGLSQEDFPAFIDLVGELAPRKQAVFLDEVQEVPEWQRLVRALLDRGRPVCVTGSNASLLGRGLGAKLTGRHRSFEVLPFSYTEYLKFTRRKASRDSLVAYLDDGGFPSFLHERYPQVLQQLLGDIIHRDIAARHRLRETRHVMNLALFLLANTGQPFSAQRLTKVLAVPSVSQTLRYLEYLQDAYAFFALPKFSPSFKQRIITPSKYYAIDNGMRVASSPQGSPDRGARLENLVYLALRRRGHSLYYAGETDRWECDFVTPSEAIQVCLELTPSNLEREVGGVGQACRLPGKRRGLILTLGQTDRLRRGKLSIKVQPVWKWLAG